MADESKLKAQAIEFLDAQPANPCMTTDDEVELFAAFAREQVKAETADLRDRLEAVERLVDNDAFAISFQSLGQYRTAILKALREGSSMKENK